MFIKKYIHKDSSKTREQIFATHTTPPPMNSLENNTKFHKALRSQIIWAGEGINKNVNRKFTKEIGIASRGMTKCSMSLAIMEILIITTNFT